MTLVGGADRSFECSRALGSAADRGRALGQSKARLIELRLTDHELPGTVLGDVPATVRRERGGVGRRVRGQPAMNTLRTIGALSLATMGLLVACEHEDSHNARSPVAGTDLTSSGATNVQAAANADAAIVDELAMARCEH